MATLPNQDPGAETDAIRQNLQKLYAPRDDDDYLLFSERTQALTCLFEMGSASARQAILGAFLDTNLDFSVRSSIAWRLKAESEPWFLEAAREIVENKADNKYVRVNAGESLSRNQDERTTNLLARVLHDTSDEVNVRRMAARVLGELGAREAVGVLIEALADSSYEVQIDAASALAGLGDPSAIEPLLRLLEQPHNDGRARGCAALYLTNSTLLKGLTIQQRQRLLAFLLTALVDIHESIWVRLHSAGALGRLGDKNAVPVLVGALGDKNSRLRASVARALGSLGGGDAIRRLIDLLQLEKDGEVKAAAIYALVDADAKDSIEFIRAALSDESGFARYAAVHAVVEFGDNAAVDQLIILLRDPDPYLRSYAIYAVGELGSEDSIPSLQRVVENDRDEIESGGDEDDGKLSTMAANAISRITNPRK